MFFDSWYGVARVVTVGGLAYVAVVAVLRVSGKRTLAKLNAFDLVITVAFGSTLASISLSQDVALLEGAAAVALLAAAQFLVAVVTTRWPSVRHFVTAEPVVVLRDGELFEQVLERERLTAGEIRQAVRSTGLGGLEHVAAVVLETDGTLSVIPRSAVGSGSALEGM